MNMTVCNVYTTGKKPLEVSGAVQEEWSEQSEGTIFLGTIRIGDFVLILHGDPTVFEALATAAGNVAQQLKEAIKDYNEP